MAGEGSRFKNAGWTTPKPLIELDGKPLFIRAIDSVKIDDVKMKYSFIVRKEHIDDYKIDVSIQEILPDAKVYYVEKTTRGAVETCLIAEDNIADDDAIVVMDCDLEFKSDEYVRLIKDSLEQSSEEARGGALVSFDSDLPRYSYAELAPNGMVVRTAEKEVISNHALCGAYFFSSGREFKEAAHNLVNAQIMEKSEFYVSLLYNRLLKDKSPVTLAKVQEYYSYGTPEELSQHNKLLNNNVLPPPTVLKDKCSNSISCDGDIKTDKSLDRKRASLTLKEILLLPAMIVPLMAYRFSTYKDRIYQDVDRFWTVHYGAKPQNYDIGIIRELAKCPEFRNLFFYRCGRIGRVLSHMSLFFLRPQKLLSFGVKRENFKGGVFIQHGYCTVIVAKSIGENFWVNQNVTIAYSGSGIPTIGDNVHIASDANIVGGIRIGNNVTVGAGTTVVRDVRDDTLVVSQKPRFIPKKSL